MPDKEELRGALARGYCSKRNKHKVLDPDLIEDMVTEVYASQQAEQETLSEEEIETILTYYGIAGRPEIAKALVGKIPCNGSGRIEDEKVMKKLEKDIYRGDKILVYRATDKEARYREALARGYCSPENSGKVLDATLIEAMVKELTALNEGKE